MDEISLLEEHKRLGSLIDLEKSASKARINELETQRGKVAEQILAFHQVKENTLSERLHNGGVVKIVRKCTRSVNQEKVAEIVEDPGQENRLKVAFVAKSSYSLDTKVWRELDVKTQEILLACGAVTERWSDADIVYTPPVLDVDGNTVRAQSPHRDAAE